MDNLIRLAGIEYESLVNGPGLRRVLFAQGCTHNCKGCFNPSTHDFNGGALKDMHEIINDIVTNPFIDGVTFSGGDPFEQADKFAYIAHEIKSKTKLNIWCYTGYTFEKILESDKTDWRELLNTIDVLVDGKFELSKKVEGLKYKGSSNQKIIDVKQSLINSKVILIDEKIGEGFTG